MEVINSNNAPEPIGPYSQAVVSGSSLYCSGQIGVDVQTGDLVSPDIEGQTRQVLKNLSSVLEAAGTSVTGVVRVEIFLVRMGDFPVVNTIYNDWLASSPVKPARITVGVAELPKGALVEVSCIASIEK